MPDRRYDKPTRTASPKSPGLHRRALSDAIQALVLGTALGLALQASQASAQQPAAEAARKTFNVPAGALEDALNTLARQAGITLSFDPALVQGKWTAALAGSYDVAEALRWLLDGSGLVAVSDGTSIVLKKAPPSAARDEAAMPTVTVLATRDPNMPLSNVPASITLVTRERIEAEQSTAAGIEEIISRAAPGFNPTNQGVRLIRGRVAQVFVNGVPTNEQLRASSGSDLNLLAPDQLDTIEVARGANSAYGFGSPGGIIALSTPRAESSTLALTTRLGTSFNPSAPGGSHQSHLYQSAAKIEGDFDYHVGLSVRRDGLVRDQDGQPALDFNSPAMFSMGKEDIYNLDTSLGWRLGKDASLRLAATAGHVDVKEHYEIDGTGTYRGTPSRLVRLPAADRNSRRHHTVNVSFEHADVAGSAVKIEALGSRVHERKYDSDTQYQDQFNEYSGLRSAVNTPLDSLYRGATLNWGLDLMRNRYFNPVIDATTGQWQRFWGPDTTLDSYAPYVQGQLPLGKLRLNAGVRHEAYRGHLETGVSSSGLGDTQGGDIAPFSLTLLNAGVVYAVEAGRELYASYSQGAEISQLSRAARSAGSAELIDPQPAKSDQYEVGLRHRQADLDFSAAAFYTDSDLMSSLQCDVPNEPCRPLREPRKYWGLEGTLDWRMDASWGFGGTLSWTEGIRTLETGEKRRIGSNEVPPLLLGTYMTYSPFAGWRNRLQFDYRASRDPFGASTDWPEGRVDSLLLVHASSSFDVGGGQLQIGLRNVFDKRHYSIVAQAYNGGYLWIPEQGRRLSLAYTVKW